MLEKKKGLSAKDIERPSVKAARETSTHGVSIMVARRSLESGCLSQNGYGKRYNIIQ